jgi:hypothetical protein
MTWQSFFNFSTMAHRHLIFAYILVLAAHAAYVTRIAVGWTRAKSSRI